MTDRGGAIEAVQAEFDRLALRVEDLPGLALSGDDALERLLSRLRAMQPAVSWHDVLPDLPKHWVPGRPETWTNSYRPLGPYDYQEPPTGPAFHITWERGGDQALLDDFIASATVAGWPVHGAGLIEVPGHDGPHEDALVVLERETIDDKCYEFAEWVNAQPGLRVAARFRTGRETYKHPTK